MTTKRFKFRAILVLVFSFFFLSLQAWEPPVIVGNRVNMKYDKPVLKVGPDGMIYIAYKYRDAAAKITDIYLNTYDGESLGVLDQISVSENHSWASYEHDLIVTEDGRVHVAWMEYQMRTGGQTQHFLRYRVWDGESWEAIRTLGSFFCDHVEDTRMTVTPNGNVHVVFMTFTDAVCRIASYYPEQGTRMQAFPLAGRSKHPDVTGDDDKVHVVWQYRPNGVSSYDVGYAVLENKFGGSWLESKRLAGNQEAGRPRILMDHEGTLHFLYNEEYYTGSKRKLWYFTSKDGVNSRGVTLMNNYFALFHFHSLALANGAVLAAVQEGAWSGGGNVYYDWKPVGATSFTGRQELPGAISPKWQSAGLSPDGSTIYICYQTNEEALTLMLSGPVVLTEVVKGKVDVTMNAVEREEMRNMFYKIVRYNLSWNIVNEEDLATITAIELYRSVQGQNNYTLLSTLGVNEGTYVDQGGKGSGDNYYDYKVRVLWLDTAGNPHWSDSLGETGTIDS